MLLCCLTWKGMERREIELREEGTENMTGFSLVCNKLLMFQGKECFYVEGFLSSFSCFWF